MKKTLNEEISRIKNMMGVLNEQSNIKTIADLIDVASSGPGTNNNKLLNGFKMIKSLQDYQEVEKLIKSYGNYNSLVAVLNGEMDSDDLATAQQIQAALKTAGVNLTFETEQFTSRGTTGQETKSQILKTGSFKVSSGAPAAPAQSQVTLETEGGWWTKHPALVAYLKAKGTPIHFPPMNNIANGALCLEVSDGAGWDFFSDGRWYQYKTVAEGLTATTKAQWEGKWSEKGNELIIVASDGDTFTSSTKQWTKPKPKMKWSKETGNFPLMYGQFGPNIKTMQAAIGTKDDSYFGPRTEKAVLAKAPEYKRETGVTQDIYNKIVGTQQPAQPAQNVTTPTPPPPTDAELQANPNTLNPY